MEITERTNALFTVDFTVIEQAVKEKTGMEWNIASASMHTIGTPTIILTWQFSMFIGPEDVEYFRTKLIATAQSDSANGFTDLYAIAFENSDAAMEALHMLHMFHQ